MLNRNGLKCIKLPKAYLKTMSGEKSTNTQNFDVNESNYYPSKTSSSYSYYLGLFNDNKNLDVNTYSLDGEILTTNSTGSYLTDVGMDATNIITFTRTVTNKTNTDYVINTVGLVYCENPNIPRYALMSCERIPTVTIKPGETYTFTHKIKIG
jgi:hypothetical protein